MQTELMELEKVDRQIAHAPQQESFESLMKLASQLVTTGFLPVAVKTPAQAVAIILTGRELGLGPMQALRSICIIQGKPELAADLQLSIFHRDGGRSKWVTLTEDEATLWLRHPNGDEHTETFTMADAKRAGLTGVNWQKYPKPMLRSRAITAGLKSIGFEPLAGAYAPGEIGGPEIVEGIPPEPTNDDDGDLGPQKQSGVKKAADTRAASASVSSPPTATAKENKPAPIALVPTVAQRDKMLARLMELHTQDAIREYATKAGILLQTESLAEWPLRFVPATVGQMEALEDAITYFFDGGEVKKPFINSEPPDPKPMKKAKAVEVPRDEAVGTWRDMPVLFGKNAGKPLGKLERSSLTWYIQNFEVKPSFTGKNGNEIQKKPEQLEKDMDFRNALVAAAAELGISLTKAQ